MFDRIVSIVMCAAGLGIYYGAALMPKPLFAGQLGPGIFPKFVGALIAIVSAFLFMETRKKESADNQWDRTLTFVLIVLVLFVGLFHVLGFVLCSLLQIVVLGRVLGFSNKWVLGVVSVLFPLFFYFLFSWLGINLPNGILPF